MSEKRSISRAEAVRLRRRQQTHKRTVKLWRPIERPLPMITSRESYTALQPTNQSKTRRRYQTVFSLPGVQIHMPTITMPRFEAGWRLLSFFISLLLGVALYLAWTLPTFRINVAQVSGNQRIKAEDINAVLGTAGQPIFTLLPSELERRIRTNYPEVSSARINLELPNVVSVSIVERQPVILWQENNGYTWIDGNGIAFRPRGPESTYKLINVNALATPPHGQPLMDDPLSPAPYVSEDLVRAIQFLAPKIPPDSTLTYDPRYGLGWTDNRGWKAYLGSDSSDMSMRWLVYQALVNSLLQRGIYPILISVQYSNAPYYRLSQ